jgi:putative two-component system response regulator
VDARILIVDDQPASVALLEELLEQGGYSSVWGVTDPRAAVGTFRTFAPDLVVLDLLMPYMDGFGVMAQIRPLVPPDRFLPIIVLTADSNPQVRRRALAAGATDFLSKPLDTAEVLLRIGNLLHTRRLHTALQHQNEELEAKVSERTRELAEARQQVLELYQELARRNRDLHELLERVARPAEPRTTEQGVVGRLTPREREVLALLAQGHTNAEIGNALVVSPTTVKSHVENIIAKLDVHDRTQAAVRAVELGLFVSSSSDLG